MTLLGLRLGRVRLARDRLRAACTARTLAQDNVRATGRACVLARNHRQSTIVGLQGVRRHSSTVTEVAGKSVELPSRGTSLPSGDWLQFHHVQVFVNKLDTLEEYKALEKRLNEFSKGQLPEDAAAARPLWAPEGGIEAYTPFQRDLVRQMLHSTGWRITAHASSRSTDSVLISSPDKAGVRFLITAPKETGAEVLTDEPFDHFSTRHPHRFFERKHNRPGVGVLAFEATPGQNALAAVLARYREKHPLLLVPDANGEIAIQHYPDGTQVLDVFAYYEPKHPGDTRTRVPDKGTLLRFVERPAGAQWPPLPGLEAVEAEFPLDSEGCRAYSDHWVSNVVDRVDVLATFEDTLGFTPKVDFNAGVVAAGEAIIESTVTGNQPTSAGGGPLVKNADDLLTNQQQVYLPINNALSPVGHVHLYVEQLGQGIQHIANRVPDLVAFVSRCSWYREATGEGFSFLNIPRSYYGVLMPVHLQEVAPELSADAAERIITRLQNAGLADAVGAVALDTNKATVEATIAGEEGVSSERVAPLADVILQSRYRNLHAFLKDRISEEDYLGVVRNKVLVDVQGDDVLYQIFTAPVLQRVGEDEAPFLEFIQRKCGLLGQIRPGCGGFGIRNFLTLFLSIEVSKAMDVREASRLAGDAAAEAQAAAMVALFTEQLDTSNPVLTAIADAMTNEAQALEKGDKNAAEVHRREKEEGQERLKVISEDCKLRMGRIRQGDF